MVEVAMQTCRGGVENEMSIPHDSMLDPGVVHFESGREIVGCADNRAARQPLSNITRKFLHRITKNKRELTIKVFQNKIWAYFEENKQSWGN